MNHIVAFAASHTTALKAVLGFAIAGYLYFATRANQRWPKPVAPWWKVLLHFLFIDLVAGAAAKNRNADGFVFRIRGVEIAVPVFSWSGALKVLETAIASSQPMPSSPAPVIQLPPPIRSGEDEKGATLFDVMLWIAIGTTAGALLFGCAHDPASKARQYVIGGYAAHGATAVVGESVIDDCAQDALAQGKASAQAQLDKCKSQRSIWSRVLHAYTDALKAAAAGIDAGEKIASKDYSGVLGPLKSAGLDLAKGLQDAGVKIPVPIPGVN